jgi:prevent-host-death family protein
MKGVVEVAPISDLRHRQNEIMAQLNKGPVILTQHGRGTAVLMSMEQWQEINECLRSMAEGQALRALYAEFDEEERELGRAGLGHYAQVLNEDEAHP